MADAETKDQESTTQIVAKNVATLSIATIIAALHENALEKCNAASKGAKVLNSAIEGEGDKAKLTSSGEHIISVIPLEEKKPIDKKTAIEVLQAYVQWFVGPDLAKKVNDTTVKALNESPNVKESKTFMSFQKFLLLEAADDEVTDGEEVVNEPKEEGKEGAEEKSSGESDKTSDGDQTEDDTTTDGEKKDDAPSGFYIPYSLKVEGLPQTALKDAMKKFAKTFFDDLTITADGLFGGGGSFTVKDVKNAWKNAFGPIDPEDLKDKVDAEINKIRHPDTDRADVEIRDKTTLISDLGKNIDAAQRKQIDSADYSLWIKLTEFDPKKPIFNQRVVADIVQSSITGIFKKFKNKITKNDVIFIPNYNDVHKNTKKLEKLNRRVPEPSAIAAKLKGKEILISKVWDDIDKMIDKVRVDNELKNSKLGKAIVNVWDTFMKKHQKDKERTSTKEVKKDVADAYFKPFIKEYKKVFDQNKTEQDLHESLHILQSIRDNNHFKTYILESMYGNQHSCVNDSYASQMHNRLANEIMQMLFEDDANSNKNAFSKDDIESISSSFIDKLTSIAKSNTKLAVNPMAKFGQSNDIATWLEDKGLLTNEATIKLDELPYAAALVLKIPQKFNDADEIDEENGVLKKGSPGFSSYGMDNVKSAVESASGQTVSQPGLEYEATANGTVHYNKTKIPAKCKVMLFFLENKADASIDNSSENSSSNNADEHIDGENDSVNDDTSNENTDSGTKDNGEDVYIIPLPGIKYKDKEHETTNA